MVRVGAGCRFIFVRIFPSGRARCFASGTECRFWVKCNILRQFIGALFLFLCGDADSNGLIADRVGPRRLLIGGIIISTLGAILFALAPSLFWAGLGRFLIGGSVAVGFVCTLKLATHWLPTEKFSLAAGLLLVAGMMGAVFAGVPLHLASGELAVFGSVLL